MAKKKVAKTVKAERKPCECGCGGFPIGKKSRFIPGHDARMKGHKTPKPKVKKAVKKETPVTV